MSIALLLILFAVSLFCLYFAIVCLIVACRENELPDIDDLERIERTLEKVGEGVSGEWPVMNC